MNGISQNYHLDEFIVILEALGVILQDLVLFIFFFDEVSPIKQNSQNLTPRSAASHLRLYCLNMSDKKITKLI